MTDLRAQLIKLGSKAPELRPSIRPILAAMESSKTAGMQWKSTSSGGLHRWVYSALNKPAFYVQEKEFGSSYELGVFTVSYSKFVWKEMFTDPKTALSTAESYLKAWQDKENAGKSGESVFRSRPWRKG